MKEPCHIHETFPIPDEENVRHKVCQTLPTEKHTDGYYYCLLHLPDANKDYSDFNLIVNTRFGNIDNEISSIKLKPISEESKKIELNDIVFDFRYVYFPKGVHFNKKVFKANADFGWTIFQKIFFNFAIFEKSANFTSAKFTEYVTFHKTKFCKEVRFDSSEFLQEVDFRRTKFAVDVYFDDAKFKAKTSFSLAKFNILQKKHEKTLRSSFIKAEFNNETDFNSAKFNADALFKSATFNAEVKFEKTYFSLTGETSFHKAKFHNDTFFISTKFLNDVSFNSAVFGNESDIIFRESLFEKYITFRYSAIEGTLRFTEIIQGENNRFNFQESIFEKANVIIFNKIRLRPSWFINSKVERIQFINCKWVNINKFLIGVEDEIQYAQEVLKVRDAEYFLKEVTKQLAINAEYLDRYEQASMFRKTSFEIERLENKKIIKSWIYNGFLFNKQLKCSIFSFDFYIDFKLCSKEILKEIGGLPSLIIYSIYRFLSGYGESVGRATLVLATIVLFLFPLIFTFTEFQISPKAIPLEVIVATECSKLTEKSKGVCSEIRHGGLNFWSEGIPHSLTTITFQDVEYRKPISGCAEFWTLLEKILVPFQAALLALAIRRKFMR